MIFGIETESKESALQRHLERSDEVARREGEIMDSIESGNFPVPVCFRFKVTTELSCPLEIISTL